MELEPAVVAAGFVGLLLTLAAGFLVGKLVKSIKKGIAVPPPAEAMKERWTALTTDPEKDKSGSLLGDLERVLFYLAFWLAGHELIAGWLALKVAAKWESWGATGRLPESLSGANDLDYLISRRRWASQRLMSFLVGTIANVLASFAAFALAKHVVAPLLKSCIQ